MSWFWVWSDVFMFMSWLGKRVHMGPGDMAISVKNLDVYGVLVASIGSFDRCRWASCPFILGGPRVYRVWGRGHGGY